MKLLIDGDPLIYIAGFAVQHTLYTVQDLSDPEKVLKFLRKVELNEWLQDQIALGIDPASYSINASVFAEPEHYAFRIVNVMIAEMIQKLEATEHVIYLTGQDNFRNQIAVTVPYKGNRTASKPVHYQAIKDHLVSIGAVIEYGLEADDSCAMRQFDDSTIICSIDKDLLQVPGKHYNYKTKELTEVTEQQAIYNLYKQVLTGDMTDNIPGIKGIGPVKAEKILANCTTEAEMQTVCLEAYVKEYADRAKERMIEVANLVYLKRSPNDEWSWLI